MKIVILIKSYVKYRMGGSEQQAFLLAKELVNRKHEVHWIFINSTLAKVPEIDDGIYLHPMRMIKIKYSGKPLFLYKNKIKKILNKLSPDIIYNRSLSPFLGIACKYKRKNKQCKVIWHVASKADVTGEKLQTNKNFITAFFNKGLIEFGIRNSTNMQGASWNM